MPPLNKDSAGQRISTLKGAWNQRNQKIREWYNQLLLENNLQQAGMESFISNNPRTAFNLALHLLTPPNLPLKIPTEPLLTPVVPNTSEVERALAIMWSRVDKDNRRRGRQSWRRKLNSYLLATGWYAIFAGIEQNPRSKMTECFAEIWSPFDTFPHFDDYLGLDEVVHSYRITLRSLNVKALDLKWKLPTNLSGTDFTIDTYWYLDEDTGQPANLVMMNGDFLQPPIAYPKWPYLPVFVSPAGGLPDEGSIITSQDWQAHVGEAMLATNEFVQNNYNRQMTFLQQLLRDTAQPVSFEKSSGNKVVNNPDELTRRGAHFRMGLQEDLGYLSKPPIPVDFRTQLFDTDSMLQRGSLPHIMYGNIMGQVTGYLISQVSASAQQHLTPYGDASSFAMGEVSNWWLWLIYNESKVSKPYNLAVPKIPENVQVEADLKISIPGDLTQRATVGKMLNPNFRVSEQIVLEMLFPEITDPIRELSRIHAEDAQNHPVAVQINLVRAYNEQADVLQAAGDGDGANMFRAAATAIAQALQQQLQAGAAGQPPQPAAGGQQQPRQEIQPRQSLEGAL